MGSGSDVVLTERKLNAGETKAFMRAVASDPDVEYVEPDAVVRGGMVPNDPYVGQQWALSSQPGIRPGGAWDLTDGAGAIIAIVDNGVTEHSDLDENLLPGMDVRAGHSGGSGFNPGITTETCAVEWHGTTVAGVLAARTNNANGMAGTAGGAKIVPVRVLDACGNGYLSDMADGIVWAAGGRLPGVPDNANPAKVINLSAFGYSACDRTLQQAINDATARGASVVTISGNKERDAALYAPGNCRNVITVGNVTFNNSRGYLSNYGQTVDVAAPGMNILTTSNAGTSRPGPESYGYYAGTSYAAPFVSGVIALVQSVAPKPLTPAEMRTLLMQNAHAFGPETPDLPSGVGVVDATATVNAAKSGNIPVAADFTCAESTNSMNITCTNLSTARSGTPIKTSVWDLDTGYDPIAVSTTVTPFANYEYPGVRQIRLTVTDANGAASTLSRPFNVLPPTAITISNNYKAATSVNQATMQYYQLDVPSGATSLTATLTPSNSSESAWLYIKAGTPSNMRPDCQQGMANGNAATCTINNPAPGSYYIIVSAIQQLNSAIAVFYK